MAEMNHIQMIVFDWAGTTTDYGGVAPSVVFDRVFQEEGICLTKEEINAPMGMEKKAHIRALLSSLSGGRQWKERYGTSWTEEDAERLYEKFEGILYQMVAEYSVPIPGVVDTVQQLRKQGLKIGSTTGYTSQMMKQVLPKARGLGYSAEEGKLFRTRNQFSITVPHVGENDGSGSGGSSSGNERTYAIVTGDNGHGSVTVSADEASAGTRITVTVKPDSGYVLDELTITDAKNKDLKVTKRSETT